VADNYLRGSPIIFSQKKKLNDEFFKRRRRRKALEDLFMTGPYRADPKMPSGLDRVVGMRSPHYTFIKRKRARGRQKPFLSRVVESDT